MSIWVDLMAGTEVDSALGERLERLTGEDAACCVGGYRDLAERIRRSVGFALALRRVKALADDHRLLAVALLKRRGELCACEIQAATGLSHPTVSHHMAALVNSGMVEARRDGKWMYYRLKGTGDPVIP